MPSQSDENETRLICPIAHIRNGFTEKFGIPRQSGLADTPSRIIFEPQYRNPEAFRGLEAYSHLWLIWDFSETHRDRWSPTVRPPRLGGNTRMGVFATRSPFRPNSLGLSCVRLDKIEYDPADGPVLSVTGADLMDQTPIYDIKPYLPYVDSIPEAEGGFSDDVKDQSLHVVFPEEFAKQLTKSQSLCLMQILSQDPRPHYQQDAGRVYGMSYDGLEIRFTVDGDTLTVRSVKPGFRS